MGNEIQKSLGQRVKDILQTDEEHSLFELSQLLREYRNNSHPDKFQDHEMKTKAEARFKEAQSLLQELDIQLESDRFHRKPSELAVYKQLYDEAQLQSELDKIKSELESMKSELKYEQDKNEKLSIELQTKQDDSLRTEIEYLKSIYKPSTRNYVSIGLGVVLTSALGVMAQMEKVSSMLEKYSPFGKQLVSSGLFFCLIIFLVMIIYKLWEREYIRRKSAEICSPKCPVDFLEYLKSKRNYDAEVDEFSEVDVFSFISGHNHWFKKLCGWLGFKIFSPETVNQLKDIFIHALLNKKLVQVSKAEMMQRHFTIFTSRSSNYWYYEYKKEKDKNQKTSTDSGTD